MSFLKPTGKKINMRKNLRRSAYQSSLVIVALLIFSLLVLVFTSGCIKQPPPETKEELLKISLDAPDKVFVGKEFSVYLDIVNDGNKTYENVTANFFDVDGFEKKSTCEASWYKIRKMEMKTVECKLEYPKGDYEKSFEKYIYANVKYKGYISAVSQLVVLTPEEYRVRESTNKLPSPPKSVKEENDELSLEISFNENPFIIDGDHAYIYIKIKNIGKGIIEKINREDFEMRMIIGGNYSSIDPKTNCSIFKNNEEICVQGDEFPLIVCDLGNFTSLEKNYDVVFITINLKYEYEIRTSRKIKIEI